MSVRDWYVGIGEDAGARVVVFPHAGAGYTRFAGFANEVGSDIGVWAANLPGRQARIAEPPPRDLTTLVRTLTDEITELTRRPYALFGYCGGAVLAFLVARSLHERGAPAPRALIVASAEAPDIAWRPRGLAGLPSGQLWARLLEDGGVPSDLAVDPSVRSLIEPAVRADFAALAGYRHTAGPPLPCPVVVCFGEDDPTPRGAWLGWRRQTDHGVRLVQLPGGHWLLDDACGGLASVVRSALTVGERV